MAEGPGMSGRKNKRGYSSKKRNQYRGNQDNYSGNFKRHRNEDAASDSFSRNKVQKKPFVKVQKPKSGRKYTISIAVPASILDETSIKDELRTYVVGQLARAAVIYSVDEVIVYDDGCCPKKDSGQENTNEGSLEKMKMLLEYQELPQYLRRYFFGFDKHLRFVGLLNPLNAPHHFKSNEWCEYREGVVLKRCKDDLPFVDVGLGQNILITKKVDPGLRVTVKLPHNPPEDFDKDCSKIHGRVVAPGEPRLEKGYYWGYSVRVANSLSEVVTGCTYPGGYDLIIGTSDKGVDAKKAEYSEFSRALIVFGGVEGLEASIAADSQLRGSEPSDLFHFYINTCSHQQVRTIRTEEAVLISLCVLHDKLSEKGINR
ncbi:putative methyltransferase C9orf114 [Macrobrachium nipponense]|uniref:putative methyltransferase C9orf114 n=1 Tax=Macrobrachium nipponense TaxID=159736 RepID=UPI0030C7CAE9